jgi:flagellar hook-length control protein FliK
MKGNVNKNQFMHNFMIAKANNTNGVRKNSLRDQNNDFKKVLEGKKDKKLGKRESKIESKDSQSHDDKKADETQNIKENDKAKDTIDSRDSKEETTLDQAKDIKKNDEAKDVKEETTLDELNIAIKNLIQTLQSNNIIDGEKLKALIKQIESMMDSLNIDGLDMDSALDLSKLKDLLVDLKLFSSSELIHNEGLKEMIDEKLDKLSKLIKNMDSASDESHVQTNNGDTNQVKVQSSKSGSSNPDLPNQDMTNSSDLEKGLSNEERELSNEEKVNSEGRETNTSMEEKPKNQFGLSQRKNLNTDTNAVNNDDMEMAVLRNIEVDNSRNPQLVELSKASANGTPKPDQNLFNQIMEGTKLSISEDVSEMFLKLKPDNLGNLSMKISIERGIVVARFDVESQMVKETIESNLEDLRNALSDKGFEIKEFNVSVNKDSDNQESSFSYFSKKKAKKNTLGSSEIKDDKYFSNQQRIESITSSIDYLG